MKRNGSEVDVTISHNNMLHNDTVASNIGDV